MSKLPEYIRDSEGKWWIKQAEIQDLPVANDFQKILEIGYQLGLQSHPTPNPDLLLTDADKLEVAKIIANGAGFGWAIADRAFYRVFADKIIDFLLSKLQQARPTTEAREKIAEKIWLEVRPLVHHTFHRLSWKRLKATAHDGNSNELHMKDCYEFADQILQLLPFPDEQGIRESERKAIGEWLDKTLKIMELPTRPNLIDVVTGIVRLKAGENPQPGQMPEDK